jgi:hypothetical protein
MRMALIEAGAESGRTRRAGLARRAGFGVEDMRARRAGDVRRGSSRCEGSHSLVCRGPAVAFRCERPTHDPDAGRRRSDLVLAAETSRSVGMSSGAQADVGQCPVPQRSPDKPSSRLWRWTRWERRSARVAPASTSLPATRRPPELDPCPTQKLRGRSAAHIQSRTWRRNAYGASAK